MFEIKEVEAINAPRSLYRAAVSCLSTWAFVVWTCICFGC